MADPISPDNQRTGLGEGVHCGGSSSEARCLSWSEPERVIIMPEGDEDMWSDEYMEIVELA
ncbi:hypothetical protein ACX3UO_08640 [Corynebacterium coyleae]